MLLAKVAGSWISSADREYVLEVKPVQRFETECVHGQNCSKNLLNPDIKLEFTFKWQD